MSKVEKQSIDWHRQLLELIHNTSLATDFQDSLTTLLEGGQQLVQSDGISVMWLEGDQLEVLASTGPTAPLPGLTLPVGQMGAARAVLDSGRAVSIADTTVDTRWRPVPGEERVRSWLGVPLLEQDRAIGLLEWTDRSMARYKDEDMAKAGKLGRLVAPILHRARLLDDTRQRLREMVEPHLTASPQPVDVSAELRPVVREALQFTDARHAFVFLAGDTYDFLRCVVALGEQEGRLRSITLRGDGTLAGWGIPGTHSAEWPNTGPSDREKMMSLGIERTLVLPLRTGSEQVGILGVAEPRVRRRFDQDAIRLMTHLASQASVILEQNYRGMPEAARYDYEMLLQSSPLGVAVLTVTGDIRVCNPALSALLSRADQSLVGSNLSEFLEQSDGRRLRHALEEMAVTGQRRQVDARVQLTEREHRYTRMSLAFAHISDDMGGNVVAIVEDVSPLKILEEERVGHLRELREKHAQLQDLDQLKSRFVSNVSHELRTPLAVIKLYATLARKGRPEKQTYYLQTIEQETHRLETMVENILDLTRLDRRALRVHPEPFAAEEVIKQVLEVYEETARKKGIELENHVRQDLPTLRADKNHLIQMLTNLLDNALKYTPQGSKIWVAAREFGSEPRRMLEIAVSDGGVGIPEDEQARIFERFYRGSNNTPGSTGTGLGLSIVHEIMTEHGGQVKLKSKVGEGSVFSLQFPLSTPANGNNA